MTAITFGLSSRDLARAQGFPTRARRRRRAVAAIARSMPMPAARKPPMPPHNPRRATAAVDGLAYMIITARAKRTKGTSR